LTWWTKDDEKEPELTDDEDEAGYISKSEDANEDPKTMQLLQNEQTVPKEGNCNILTLYPVYSLYVQYVLI
jgi:hypothetical protein